MPIIQVSQIILRSGPSIDLPGAPTSLTPPAFAPGLLPGELAYMEDTGRIYMGHNPASGQAQFNRLTFPWQNIEVLTENSTDTLQRIIGLALREQTEFAYYSAQLDPSSTGWQDVIVPRVGDDTYVYRIEFDTYAAAQIEYGVFDDATNAPLKVGVLNLSYATGEAEPTLIDDANVFRRLDLLEPEAHQAASVYQHVDFKFTVAGPLDARYLSFQYTNHTDSTLQLRFKVTRPRV